MSSSSSAAPSALSSQVSQKTVKTLAIFTALMVIAPLITFYVSAYLFFADSRQWSGLVAALSANVVLLSYVVYAFREDNALAKSDEKKDQ
ncbi:uncharacterized protein V1510DRAFT_410082 [Dipodascopsis tothii]|uniref:uncharacterized protein n=1 Tax=Dipodascopsis tothii TaxID=44089 RepID=UPI0034CECC45